ncbi:MAG: hypothetical protein Q4B62_07665 [Clostridiaceae bacterium]|nr:hypothetical protein [Clostridiaceae bacterium]
MASEMVNAVLSAEKDGAREAAEAVEKSNEMIAEAKANAAELEKKIKLQAECVAKDIISAAESKSREMQEEAEKNAKIKASEIKAAAAQKSGEAVKALIDMMI